MEVNPYSQEDEAYGVAFSNEKGETNRPVGEKINDANQML